MSLFQLNYVLGFLICSSFAIGLWDNRVCYELYLKKYVHCHCIKWKNLSVFTKECAKERKKEGKKKDVFKIQIKYAKKDDHHKKKRHGYPSS